MSNHTVIIGAGISGLYSAYKLQERYPDEPIHIFEKEITIGGRLHSVIASNGCVIDLGAARFNLDTHHLVRKLIKLFDIKINAYPYSIESNTPDNVLKELQLLKKFISSENTLSFFDLLKMHPNTLFFENVIGSLGYDVLRNTNLSINEGYRILNCHPELLHNGMPINKWQRIQEGFYSLASTLNKKLQQCNIAVNFSHELLSITTKKSQHFLEIYHAGEIKTFSCKNLILALPIAALRKIKTNHTMINTAQKSIVTISLFKAFLTFAECWWEEVLPENIYYMTSTTPLRRIYFNKKQKQIFIYSDSESAERLNNLFMNSGMSRAIQFLLKQLSQITGIQKILSPIEIHYKFWPDGVSFWNLNKDANILSKKFITGTPNLTLLSDMFSTHSGWVEGALQNVEQWIDSIKYRGKYVNT